MFADAALRAQLRNSAKGAGRTWNSWGVTVLRRSGRGIRRGTELYRQLCVLDSRRVPASRAVVFSSFVFAARLLTRKTGGRQAGLRLLTTM